MSDEDRRISSYACEICGKPANIIKGGFYKEARDIWIVCKECESIITDERKR